MKSITLFLLWSFLFSSTAFSQGTIEVLKIRQSGCKGTCPVYEVTLSKKGLLVYEGIKFTDSLGKYIMQVGPKNARKIFAKLEKNKVMSLPDSYPIHIADIPMLFYTIKTRTTEKIINRANAGPAFLQTTLEDILKLSKRYKWKKVIT